MLVKFRWINHTGHWTGSQYKQWSDFTLHRKYLEEHSHFELEFEDREELLCACLKFPFLKEYREEDNVTGQVDER